MGPEGTPVCATGRSLLQRHRRLRGHGSNADLLVQSQACYQFHYLALRLDGRARTSNPGTRSSRLLAREHSLPFAAGPSVAGAGIEPACEAYETSLIPDPPQCDGVTGRTRTGFLRVHNPACRPLQLRSPSTREESNLRPPACHAGALPLAPRVAECGPRSARISSCRVSTGRSTVRASGPSVCS